MYYPGVLRFCYGFFYVFIDASLMYDFSKSTSMNMSMCRSENTSALSYSANDHDINLYGALWQKPARFPAVQRTLHFFETASITTFDHQLL